MYGRQLREWETWVVVLIVVLGMYVAIFTSKSWGAPPQAPRVSQAPPVVEDTIPRNCGCGGADCECGDLCDCNRGIRNCSGGCPCEGNVVADKKVCNCSIRCSCGCNSGEPCSCANASKLITTLQERTSYLQKQVDHQLLQSKLQSQVQPIMPIRPIVPYYQPLQPVPVPQPVFQPLQYRPQPSYQPNYQPMMSMNRGSSRGGSC